MSDVDVWLFVAGLFVVLSVVLFALWLRSALRLAALVAHLRHDSSGSESSHRGRAS